MTQNTRTEQQNKSIKLTVAILSVVVVCVVLAIVLKVLTDKPDLKAELSELSVIWFDTPRQVPDVALVDHHGEPFSISQFEGQWNLINFGYTSCPDICPTNMADMNIAHRILDEQGIVDQVSYWMITVDPERDTAERMALYAPYFNSEFVGLTGNMENIQTIATQLSAVFYQEGTGEGYTVAHSDNYAVLDPNGHFVALMRPPHKPQTIAQALSLMIQAK
jgi:protein SCO1/2